MRQRQRTETAVPNPDVESFYDFYYQADIEQLQLDPPEYALTSTHSSDVPLYPLAIAEKRWMNDELGRWPWFGDCHNLKADLFSRYPDLVSSDMLGMSFLSGPVFTETTTACQPSRVGLLREVDFLMDMPNPIPLIGAQFDRVDWVKRGNQAFTKHFHPSLTGDLSLVNFLIELKDLLTLAKFLKSQRGLLSRVGNAFSEGKTLEVVIQSISQGFLTWAFGILPLVRDLGNIADRLVNWYRLAAEFDDLSSKPLYRHANGDPVVFEPPFPDATMTVHREGVPILLTRTARWIMSPYTATMGYSYSVPEVAGVVKQIRQFAAVLGLNLDAAIVWNAIPYSFVIDWVYDVSGYLTTFRTDAYAADMTVHDYCHSVKGELVVEYAAHGYVLDSVSGLVIPGTAVIAQDVYTAYQRNRFRPAAFRRLPSERAPSALQIALGLALLGARIDYQPKFMGS